MFALEMNLDCDAQLKGNVVLLDCESTCSELTRISATVRSRVLNKLKADHEIRDFKVISSRTRPL